MKCVWTYPLIALLLFACSLPSKPGGNLSTESNADLEKVLLGKALFHDRRLSGDGTLSCADCHNPEKSFTNGLEFGVGVRGQKGDRNVPTLIHRRNSKKQFWDMRADSLESQALMVITNEIEMGAQPSEVEGKLNSDQTLRDRFQKVFGHKADLRAVAEALAAYERTLESGITPYDRYLAGDKKALSGSQLRGRDLFIDKFKCVSCHSGPNFTDERLRPRCYPFTNNLLETSEAHVDSSRKFKTPTLRNLIYTGPYMHNGSLSTLEDVVEFYNPSLQLDDNGRIDRTKGAVRINASEKAELVDFLKSLSADTPFVERN
jgi:cytochrome c peroxidase